MTGINRFRYALLAGFWGMWAITAAQAANITVTTTVDEMVANGACSLREAIINANDDAQTSVDCPAGSGADHIQFNGALAGGIITLGGNTLPTITAPLTISGPVADNPAGLTIDGDEKSRIFNVAGAATSDFKVEINNLGMTGKNPDASGGALAAASVDLELHYVHIFNNVNDAAFGVEGGGGLNFSDGTLVLINCIVTDNSVTDIGPGGGLYVRDGNITLIDSVVSDNRAQAGGFVEGGGGIAVIRGNAEIINSTIDSNGTIDGAGGGLYLSEGNATLTNSTLSSNFSSNSRGGGGLYVDRGDAFVTNSTLHQNTAVGSPSSRGGGMHIDRGNATVTNSTLSDNGATALGNGIYIADAAGTPGTLTLTNSTNVTGTFSTTEVETNFNDAGSSFELHNSLIDGSCGQMADIITSSLATDASCTGTATSSGDINLGPLAENGGPTQTRALQTPSVAIDAAAASPCETTDQRGVPRPQGTDCDIGAFEAGAEFDFGDTPAPYPTLLSANGASHVRDASGPVLGSLIDSEADGQPATNADGDDSADTADEDGVFFTSAIKADNGTTVDITVTNDSGLLNAWIDFNADGDWGDTGEQIFTNRALALGSNSLSFPVPASAIAGDSYARFRLNSTGGLSSVGLAPDGEVEDYKVLIERVGSATVNDVNGDPVSFTTNKGTITNLRLVADPTAPSELLFPNGFFSFEITGILTGQSVELTIDLPAGSDPEKVIKCTDSGCAEFPSFINGNQIVMTLTDGGAGDADGVADGVITDPVGPAKSAPGPSGADGTDGMDGADGTDGADGAPGPEGPAGPEGPPGPKGEDGKDGADGKDGEDGDDAWGCTIGSNQTAFDPMLSLLVLMAGLYLGTRKRKY